MSMSSSADFEERLVPALSIARPYSSRLTPAISASSAATAGSEACVVGDLRRRVSEIKPDKSKPATSLGTSTLFSLNIRKTIEDADPTGSNRIINGLAVSKLATR